METKKNTKKLGEHRETRHTKQNCEERNNGVESSQVEPPYETSFWLRSVFLSLLYRSILVVVGVLHLSFFI